MYDVLDYSLEELLSKSMRLSYRLGVINPLVKDVLLKECSEVQQWSQEQITCALSVLHSPTPSDVPALISIARDGGVTLLGNTSVISCINDNTL
jgi:hypothetical protein